MGITIGDALTVVSIVIGVSLSIWALLVAFALFFPNKAGAARVEVEQHPWRSLLIGAVFGGLGLVLYSILLALPNPLLKGLAVVELTWVMAVMTVGGSGLCLLGAERIRELDRRRSTFRALERSAALMVVGSLLPLIGWFVIAPALFCISLGAGVQMTVFRRRSAPSIAAQTEAVRARRTHSSTTANAPSPVASSTAGGEFVL